ncbi:DNA-binding protein [Shewanella sp. Isolate11]|uniref:DNA-binding protein n=1 Tax=Shewanella sp. Isolate11 TaxID=2908530 RepID=UPI001EFD1A9F|nr:DNA-binding protein [Shewanella sp. Isolate11]MCG9697950.1 DNA-binding protein [Shewanella sp. Isolate11]
MKSWLVCIDDTDDIGTKGTGEIAEEIAVLLSNDQQLSRCSFVTRHQLYVHPDIPYTSHNSAMCFQVRTSLVEEEILSIAVAHLVRESAKAADPGIALLDLYADVDHQALIEFGLQTKQEVKTKADAYQLAAQLGIHLSEHGGTGQGVIGALAGLGLRLHGNDGRIKGQFKIKGIADGEVNLSVAEVIEQTGVDRVLSDTGESLCIKTPLVLSGKLKAVYRDHQVSLLVYQQEGVWRNAIKQQLKHY